MTSSLDAYGPGPFEVARRKPVALLAGLVVGVLSAVVMLGVLWILVPVAPVLLCVATVFSRRTQAFSMGALAAALGVWTFLLLLAGLMMGVGALGFG